MARWVFVLALALGASVGVVTNIQSAEDAVCEEGPNAGEELGSLRHEVGQLRDLIERGACAPIQG
jgi:hypothetical protein